MVENPTSPDSLYQTVHRRISFSLKFILSLGALLLLLQGRYQSALEVALILLITLLPIILGNRFKVSIPHEFESLAVIFVFMALFLGEVRGYYLRFWWWDVVLHISSGLLLGILGFLLVYVLNEKKEIDLELRPTFIAVFAFMFAMGMGALWEIFEFAMDQVFGMNMQKSGIVDTMWDLIVDGLGALVISFLGWVYLRRGNNKSFLERWIHSFIDKNPRLFRRS